MSRLPGNVPQRRKEKGCDLFSSVPNPQILSREFSATNPRPGVLCQRSSARHPQPAILNEEPSARSLQPGVLREEFSARRFQRGILSQGSSGESCQPGIPNHKSSASALQPRILIQDSCTLGEYFLLPPTSRTKVESKFLTGIPRKGEKLELFSSRPPRILQQRRKGAKSGWQPPGERLQLLPSRK